MAIVYFIFLFSFNIGLIQADSGGKNPNVSAERERQAGFSDPETLAFDLIEKVLDFENFRQQDDFLMQLGNYFDFSAIARFVLGPAVVKQIDEADLREFIALFAENQMLSWLPALKSANFTDSIKLMEKRSIKKNKTLLIFNYVGENNKSVEFSVYIREAGGLVKIYDLQIEGIRMLRFWRSEFQSLIRSKGFEGMMDVLRDKLERKRIDYTGSV